ncbi:hypothetical protein GH714_011059 [Hevea brasiliensis]|uniref:Glycerol-3-phosphate acyltransferase RAM2/GPAT1-8 HAD-like domain-containing protein n=1 Tax=Hevea brasiliensis TaxID=3981 RepID=A0A6A6N2X5_HEVBR|nr:hypothetical protein GH714_011059 [Hevea brasiliensis]
MEHSVVSELEGSLLKDPDPFSYFMLVAFEASGLLRFALLLILWPVICLLDVLGVGDSGLKLMIFVATAGVRESEIESDYGRRFVKEHLRADEVVGSELALNRFGFSTGFIKCVHIDSFISRRVAKLFIDEKPTLGLGRTTSASPFLSLCKEQMHPPFIIEQKEHDHQLILPLPVIFHDGRLVKSPTPSTALVVILWIPLGIILALMRIVVGIMLPMWAKPYLSPLFGGKVIVKGKPPRQLPMAVVVSFSDLITDPHRPINKNPGSGCRENETGINQRRPSVCPEGTTCREPFLLRFSALFAELTDRIVPVAMNYRVGFFHATTARGWKALDPIFFFMNPRPVYEVTFLNQLPVEATCLSGKSPHDVANYVQRMLAATLGFECTNFTRKDKYRVLAGNDGTVSYTSFLDQMKKAVSTFKPFFH